ncbi:DUF1203 domain-containing protein [Nakamurella antarctica]|uniref:DUF1203 domain-containing protein n=1 Tax=Nakamurella antarctica TaxID=1902245 RepID=A0A3G8ZMZ9_9ACTN|nr:DUF1203 domain-containing protein [Nakamurella antarctica]
MSGEKITLISYAPFEHPSLWREVGPVYIHAARCEGYVSTGKLPAQLAVGPVCCAPTEPMARTKRISVVNHTAAIPPLQAHHEAQFSARMMNDGGPGRTARFSPSRWRTARISDDLRHFSRVCASFSVEHKAVCPHDCGRDFHNDVGAVASGGCLGWQGLPSAAMRWLRIWAMSNQVKHRSPSRHESQGQRAAGPRRKKWHVGPSPMTPSGPCTQGDTATRPPAGSRSSGQLSRALVWSPNGG